MSHLTGFSNPLLLGFDNMERLLDRVSKTAADGFPPYNIERLYNSDGKPDRLRITLAVAGFDQANLDITLEENELTVTGEHGDDAGESGANGGREFLYRGIAARRFKRTFILAEGMNVIGAELHDGLLSIDLVRPEPEKVTRKIAISSKS